MRVKIVIMLDSGGSWLNVSDESLQPWRTFIFVSVVTIVGVSMISEHKNSRMKKGITMT